MTEPRHLTDVFDDALRLAHDFHRTHIRKGTEIPYFAHLLQVSGLVLEAGGDEEQARDCRYSHEERVAGASDHSMLIVDLERV